MTRRLSLTLLLLVCLMPVMIGQAASPLARDYWPTYGWQITEAAAQGMDAAQLEAAHKEIEANLPHIHSLLVVRHGYLVWETYYGKYTRDTRHNVMSVTKSVTSALIGIALDRGYIDSADHLIADYFPEQFASETDDHKRAITLRHLLTMRSGLAWSEPVPFSPEADRSLNSVNSVLGLSMAYNPGEVWVYSTGDSHLLSAVLTKTTGMSALAFADQTLFGPLGITNRRWRADLQGNSIGGIDLSITPRDMAKFGYLYLNNGFWDGQQIVSADWVNLTTSPQPGMSPGEGMPTGFGYGWWMADLRGYRTYFAQGYGGQYIFVTPALDLVAVMTGYEPVKPDVSSYNQFRSLQIFEAYVIPAVTSP